MIYAEDRDRTNQDIAHRRLLSAVVALAIRDACHIHTIGNISDQTRNAINFLFNHSDGYLSLLDINPQQFRAKLIESVYRNDKKFVSASGLSEIERKRFANNYGLWLKEQNDGIEKYGKAKVRMS